MKTRIVNKMNPFHSLDQDSPLDALTVYYDKYRLILEKNWKEEEFSSVQDTLLAILNELNKRKGSLQQIEEELPRDFSFERQSH